MTWITQLFGKFLGRRSAPTQAAQPSPVAPAPPAPSPSATWQPTSHPDDLIIEVEEDEVVAEHEEVEEEDGEADPTIGRYEQLQVPVLDAGEIKIQRAEAEAQALAGPNKVFPHDPAGPGSLAETLARLEAQGRVVSRVCDDQDGGFYVLYEPKP
jgi:hypothetical protein